MDPIENLLTRGVDAVYPSKQNLEKVLRSGKKLTLYQGFDPTSPQLHIGHAVGLRKMRQFQDLGHKVIFLIGDFTGMIGDPTGKTTQRKVLTREEVLENAKQYKEQASKILRFTGENPVEIKYNSEWLGSMSAIDFIRLSHHLTYSQIIERDMFQERIKNGQDISMNEFLYPFLQGYDSVAMDVDMEIGGSDQMFNMMMGRKLMHNILKKEKFVLTTPLLTDSQGNKIGKTEGNAIALADEPDIFYAKIMSLGDDAIIPCMTILTDIPLETIHDVGKRMKDGANPMVYKKMLALELTKQFNSEIEANEAQKEFETRFQKGNLNEADLPSISLTTLPSPGGTIDYLTALEFATSNSDARRLVAQGAVSLNDVVIVNPKEIITVKVNDIFKVGRKAVKIAK
jgi:tyrosyl-tRNA synthetase